MFELDRALLVVAWQIRVLFLFLSEICPIYQPNENTIGISNDKKTRVSIIKEKTIQKPHLPRDSPEEVPLLFGAEA